MQLLESFHKPGVLACNTFIFDELALGGDNTMLALSEDGFTVSQWTAGRYEPGGDDCHLGTPVVLSTLGARALDGFFSRLSIPEEWEAVHTEVERITRRLAE